MKKNKWISIFVICFLFLGGMPFANTTFAETKTVENTTESVQKREALFIQSDTQIATEEFILNQYKKSNFSIQNPMVIQNPYDTAPLTALALFHTEKPAQIKITVQGKDSYTNVEHFFPDFTQDHQIPILGLYPGYENTVTLTAIYQDSTQKQKKIDHQNRSSSRNTSKYKCCRF